jgi:hypothetical protein
MKGGLPVTKTGSTPLGQRQTGRLVHVGPARRWNYLAAGGLLIVLWCSVGSFRNDGLRAIRDTWRGAARPTEFVQDFIGARALRQGTNPYPILGQGAEEFGLAWPIAHRSTHPPTAFLLALPLAGLPWDTATGWWMAAMAGLLALTAVALGVRRGAWPAAVVSLLWAPAAWSLCQLTPLWLAGLVLAWRLQSRPWLAGAAIGVASLRCSWMPVGSWPTGRITASRSAALPTMWTASSRAPSPPTSPSSSPGSSSSSST